MLRQSICLLSIYYTISTLLRICNVFEASGVDYTIYGNV